MDYPHRIRIIGCTLAIRREYGRHAQHLIAMLTMIRDILKHDRS